jgi:hypothetical protein
MGRSRWRWCPLRGVEVLLGEAARLWEGTGGATLVEIGLAEPITDQGIG